MTHFKLHGLIKAKGVLWIGTEEKTKMNLSECSRGGQKRQTEGKKRVIKRDEKNEEKEIIISPNGLIEGGRFLSRAISHLYANLHY